MKMNHATITSNSEESRKYGKHKIDANTAES